MKKSLVALAVLGAFAGTAAAQSSVTLYGAFMLSAQKSNNGQGIKLDNANGTNWVGVRGSEDLGSGTRAIFDIQWRFSPESGGNDGSNNARPVFQGKTAAGLAGASWGQVEVGRMLSPLQLSEAKGDPFISGGTISLVAGSVDLAVAQYATDPLTSGSAALGGTACTRTSPNNLSTCGDGAGLARTDMFFYTSPNWSGVTLQAAYGFKNSAASGTTVNQQKNFNSFWLQYNNGPIYVGAGREQNRRNDKVMVVNGWYDFGVVKVSGAVGKLDKPTVGGAKGSTKEIGVQMPFGAFTAKLGYGQVKDQNTGYKSFNKTGFGGDYALSKRTYLFSTYGYTKNKTPGTATPVTKAVDLGIRHTF